MVVIPCSAGALGSIAAGTADDLLTRAADVCLKERRPLVLCLRETPLNRIHLENMLRVHDAGATVMPAMPAFYYEPKTIDDMVEQFGYRVLAQLGLPQEKQYRWRSRAQASDKTRARMHMTPWSSPRFDSAINSLSHCAFALTDSLSVLVCPPW